MQLGLLGNISSDQRNNLIRQEMAVRAFQLTGAPMPPCFIDRPSKCAKWKTISYPFQQCTRKNLFCKVSVESVNPSWLIFLVTAKSIHSVSQGMNRIKDRVEKIPGCSKSVKSVLNWFSAENNHEWLLIIDNYDFDEDDELDELLDMLLINVTGSFIFPSRLNSLSNELGASSVALKDLSVGEALDVLSQTSESAKGEQGKTTS